MIDIAREAALKAGRVVLKLRSQRLKYFIKEKPGDFTTQADISSEKIIIKTLKSKFPRHNFLSEEIGNEDNGSSFRWIIDPIDGTIPYSSGLPTFGISIGLLKNNKPFLGVINLPALGSLFWAEKGKGAFLNGKRIKVSAKDDLTETVIGFDLAHMGGRKAELKKLIAPLVDKVRYAPSLGCTVAGLSHLASGVYDGFIHSAYPWDYAAGAIIIEEAGGKITDYQGKPIDWTKDWIDFFASNGLIHRKILALIK